MLDSVNIYFYFLTPVQLNLDSNIPRLSNPMDQSWEDLHKTDILIVDQPAHKTSQLSFLERNHSPIPHKDYTWLKKVTYWSIRPGYLSHFWENVTEDCIACHDWESDFCPEEWKPWLTLFYYSFFFFFLTVKMELSILAGLWWSCYIKYLSYSIIFEDIL